MRALYQYFADYASAQVTVLHGTKIYLATVDVCLKALANKVGGATRTLFNNKPLLGVIVDEHQRVPELSLHAFLVACPALLAVGDRCQDLESVSGGALVLPPLV